jgi:hypothetical protein
MLAKRTAPLILQAPLNVPRHTDNVFDLMQYRQKQNTRFTAVDDLLDRLVQDASIAIKTARP